MSNNIYNFSKSPSMPEKILSALAYFSLGTIGIILIILTAITKTNLKSFMKFNAFQSVLVGFIFAFIQYTYNLLDMILQIFKIIPFLGKYIYSFFLALSYYLFGFPIIAGMSFLAIIMLIIILYLAILAFLGKKPYIPVISPAIKRIV